VVFDETTRNEISANVINPAYEIIAGKVATNLAIGLSTARIIEAVLGDQHRVLPVSTVQRGVYEISDVCLSLPTAVTAAGAGQMLEVPLSASELLGPACVRSDPETGAGVLRPIAPSSEPRAPDRERRGGAVA